MTSQQIKLNIKLINTKISNILRKSKSGRGSAVIYGMRKISKEKNINHIVEMDTDLSSHLKNFKKYKNI